MSVTFISVFSNPLIASRLAQFLTAGDLVSLSSTNSILRRQFQGNPYWNHVFGFDEEIICRIPEELKSLSVSDLFPFRLSSWPHSVLDKDFDKLKIERVGQPNPDGTIMSVKYVGEKAGNRMVFADKPFPRFAFTRSNFSVDILPFLAAYASYYKVIPKSMSNNLLPSEDTGDKILVSDTFALQRIDQSAKPRKEYDDEYLHSYSHIRQFSNTAAETYTSIRSEASKKRIEDRIQCKTVVSLVPSVVSYFEITISSDIKKEEEPMEERFVPYELRFANAEQNEGPDNFYSTFDPCVAIGVGPKVPGVIDKMPGWELPAVGYHGDDGHLYYGFGRGYPFGPKFGQGDTVGCGIVYVTNKRHDTCSNMPYCDDGTGSSQLDPFLMGGESREDVGVTAEEGAKLYRFGQQPTVFFTHNGKLIPTVFPPLFSNQSYYPAIGIDCPHIVTFNFGYSIAATSTFQQRSVKPFVFDIETFNRGILKRCNYHYTSDPPGTFGTIFRSVMGKKLESGVIIPPPPPVTGQDAAKLASTRKVSQKRSRVMSTSTDDSISHAEEAHSASMDISEEMDSSSHASGEDSDSDALSETQTSKTVNQLDSNSHPYLAALTFSAHQKKKFQVLRESVNQSMPNKDYYQHDLAIFFDNLEFFGLSSNEIRAINVNNLSRNVLLSPLFRGMLFEVPGNGEQEANGESGAEEDNLTQGSDDQSDERLESAMDLFMGGDDDDAEDDDRIMIVGTMGGNHGVADDRLGAAMDLYMIDDEEDEDYDDSNIIVDALNGYHGEVIVFSDTDDESSS